jgi:tocopherol cyclase
MIGATKRGEILAAKTIEKSIYMPSHHGYHWRNDINSRFFEGWYYRISLPEINQSFAFMYAIDDPQTDSRRSTAVSGGSVQVLGIDDRYLWRTLPNSSDFYAAYDRLFIEHYGKQNRKLEGYSASDRHNCGYIKNPVNGDSCTWEYKIQPIYAWGERKMGESKPTMGIWSYLPIFEPGWQILSSHALATGKITWNTKEKERVYAFQNAPAYSEKNWGRSFPSKWFWLQSNSFANVPNLTVTAAGGIRKYLGQSSEVATIGLYYQGQFYRFMPDSSEIHCQIKPWGSWQISATNATSQIKLSGSTNLPGKVVMTPTAKGLCYNCRDTGQGNLTLDLRSLNNKIIVRAESNLAALEVGGELIENKHQTDWNFTSAKI